ncbi:hypothetical protein L1049_024358 [Liquidambar formosana]|uniref:Uncharacterized protein n=1 Tax=Liquidambar formosana TaxID=63359 RepID=A0AAP0WZJ0_LIQFO
MAMHFIFSIVFLSILAKIGEKLVEKIGEYVVVKIGDYVVAPIRRRLGYVRYYNSNIEDLRNQVQNLRDTRVRVDKLVEAAKTKGKVILPNVRKWLTRVDKITEESRKFFEEETHTRLMLMYRRSKIAKEMTADVDELKREGTKFDRVSKDPLGSRLLQEKGKRIQKVPAVPYLVTKQNRKEKNFEDRKGLPEVLNFINLGLPFEKVRKIIFGENSDFFS